MAGDWIPLRDNVHDDPDVFRIASALGVRDTDTIVGKVTRFWCWASEHSRDGSLPGVTTAFIDTISKQKGLADAMIECGWLSKSGGTIAIPNFDRWMSKGAKARLGETQRKQMQRRVPEMSGQSSGQCPDICPDKNGTREEKRREEEKTPPTPKPAAVVDSDLRPKDPDEAAKFDALAFAGIGDKQAARFAAMPHFRLETIRNTANYWRQQGRPPDGKLVSAMNTAARQDLARMNAGVKP